MLDGVVDDHDDAVIGNRGLLGEGQDGAADLDGFEEGDFVG